MLKSITHMICCFLLLCASFFGLVEIALASESEVKSVKHVGILIFPGVYQLDVTAPYGVFASAPDTKIHLIWKDLKPVTSSDGLVLTPTITFTDCPTLDVICVPGGAGLFPLLNDEMTITFLQKQTKQAKYVTSVCTGALLLAASGGLEGYKGTTHWHAKELLQKFDVEFVSKRVVVDRNRITAAGVSAGLDMALVVTGKVWGDDVAKEIELTMEYDPQPPFGTGTPATAPKAIVDKLNARVAPYMPKMQEAINNAAARLHAPK